MKRIVLASASPRRRELLTRLGVAIEVIAADVDEKVGFELAPEELVTGLAGRKARAVAGGPGFLPGAFVCIAADTVVALDGRILGKPDGEREAAAMLRALSGRAHEVYTGIAVTDGSRLSLRSCCTRVSFRELCDREIDAYVASGEPMDKAGAYGIQGAGALFVSGIEGDYYNVVGLPLCTLCLMLRDYGVELAGNPDR